MSSNTQTCPTWDRIALCGALDLPAPEGAEPPAWIHLLPAGEIATADRRGPYRVADVGALITASMAAGSRLPLDENHATDLAAPLGQPAPARGWIVELQARPDGVWGQVEWTEAGRQLVTDRAYRHISPVIAHAADKTVTGILRASLVNRPNLRGLATLHAEDPADDEVPGPFLVQLRAALGLSADAGLPEILARAAEIAPGSAMHAAQLAPVASIVGMSVDADPEAVLQAVRRLADPAVMVPAETALALQAEIVELKSGHARQRAEAAVEAAIKAGKIMAPAKMRPYYVARHMADPDGVDAEFGAMISLNASRGVASAAPPSTGAAPALDVDESRVAGMLGLDAATWGASKAALSARDEH